MSRAINGRKVCSKCKVEKKAAKEYFPPDARSADSFQPACRKCKRVQDTEYYLRNRSVIKAGMAEYRSNLSARSEAELDATREQFKDFLQRCCSCKEEKPCDEFMLDRSKKRGYGLVCLDCVQGATAHTRAIAQSVTTLFPLLPDDGWRRQLAREIAESGSFQTLTWACSDLEALVIEYTEEAAP